MNFSASSCTTTLTIILRKKPVKLYFKNWLQFLLVVKAAALKQQILKFYPQILSTEPSHHICDRPLTELNIMARFCALNLRIEF